MSYSKKYTEDSGHWWVEHFDRYRMGLYKFFSGVYAKIILKWRGVRISGKTDFYGIPHIRRALYSSISIGRNCTFRSDQTSNLIGVNRPCILSTHEANAVIEIGDNCGFSGTTIGAAKEIRIGNNVLCGANVVITDFDWHNDISNTEPAPVIIHDNVWIGLNSVVLKGVEIGENTIVGANSLVVRSLPANAVAGGNPCKVLKIKEPGH
jgi:acetyltransferase-like isoleucine patch superfamily enzyme